MNTDLDEAIVQGADFAERVRHIQRRLHIQLRSRSDGIEPLRHSLVLNAITSDEDLIDDLVNEPTVTNVYRGHHRTYHMTRAIPHDGYLADFLMRTKGVIRD
jgi:hypothetical protein